MFYMDQASQKHFYNQILSLIQDDLSILKQYQNNIKYKIPEGSIMQAK